MKLHGGRLGSRFDVPFRWPGNGLIHRGGLLTLDGGRLDERRLNNRSTQCSSLTMLNFFELGLPRVEGRQQIERGLAGREAFLFDGGDVGRGRLNLLLQLGLLGEQGII